MLYAADDIILVTSSVSVLQNALKICQRELEYLDMAINTKKTCCLRIGPWANISCTPVQTLYHCNGLTKFPISASILYDLLILKFPRIGPNVRFIMLQTVFSAELDVLLRKKFRYSFSIANVSRYCYMAWKPVRLTRIRLPILTLS